MSIKRFLLGLAALLLAAPCLAVSLADRSPFYQGHWWDPNRSGNGFEIFNAADTVQVIWYTFDDLRRPVWYTAQGPLNTLGTQNWPLLHHRWVDGRKAEPTVVGSLRLEVRHAESLDVVWGVNGRVGTWPVQPFFVSGVVNEVDHTGSWFDPANSGWGISLTEQGNVLGGVLFTYDPSGEPTWFAGFQRDTGGSVEVFAATGSCPGCTLLPTATLSAGRLAFDFRAEAQLVLRTQLTRTMAAGVNADGANLVMFSRPASWRGADRQLARFDVESLLKAYLDAGMLNVASPSSPVIVLPSAEPSVVTFSTTNVQETGVDEADLVKSNGRQLYAYAHDSRGNRLPVVRVAVVSNEGSTLTAGASVALASGAATPMTSAGLFVAGDKLVSVTGTTPTTYGYYPAWPASGPWLRGTTNVEVLGLANPDIPATRWRAEIDGHPIASRRIGDRLYVVTRFVPYLPGFYYGNSNGAVLAGNRQILAGTPLSGLVPKMRINGGEPAAAVAVSATYAAPQGSRAPMADMVMVTAIDLGEPRVAQTLTIAGPVETVYASTGNLYLASSRYQMRSADGMIYAVQPPFYLTDIHQIRLGSTAMGIVGSASIEGHLGYDADGAPFRLGEYEGRLRAVTSSSAMWGGSDRNRLTILEPSATAPGLLKTVSYLPNTRRPQTLGKPNELLFGTRFVGNRLYAVTFKKTDPLYIVDLADVNDPRIAGELVVPGFSDYLHPLPNNLLLGFGKDAKPTGTQGDGQWAWYQGLQLTLFDVSDAGQPREIQRLLMGKRGSESALLRHHHAFSVLTQADGSLSIAIPARIHDSAVPQGAYPDWTTYPWLHSGLLRFEMRGGTASDARLTQLPTIVTHVPPQVQSDYYTDAGADGGRSVLFRNGAIYYGKGVFWRQDSAGNTVGPY